MMMFTRRAVGASSIALMAGCAAQSGGATNSRGPAAIGSFGIDLSGRDMSVDPGNDFFRYANGAWLDRTEIPADRTNWGTFAILRDKSDRDQRVIIEEVALAGGPEGSNRKKIADIYNSFLNQEAIDSAGLAPIQADLDAIAAARTHEQIARLMSTPSLNTNGPILAFPAIDARRPQQYTVTVTHAGLGLPEREYYRRTDGEFPNLRAGYLAHIERTFGLINQPNGAAAKAQAILALETQIAERHWAIADRRERDRTYNLKSRADLRMLAPSFPWDAGLDAAGLGDVSEVIVREESAMGPLAELFVATPVATWRDYLTFHLVNNSAGVLPKPIDDANFEFFGRTLNGQPQQRDRWKRAIDKVNNAMGEAVGELYVQRHFPPEAKAQMLELVENLRRAYGERIDALSWMSAETKVVAREKLAAFLPRIGYPDRWRDYAALETAPGEAYANTKRAAVYQWNYGLGRLRRPVDRGEWNMTPQTVNASYNAQMNVITFPAAILQAPFFDPNADAAVNYGAIVAVIGHEMGHGFDDQGAKSDAQGVLRDWWSASDVTAFSGLVAKLAAQYDQYEPLPGIRVNGRLTSGENIGDNGGLQVALHAYRLSLNGQEPPVLEGLSGDQRFFLGWAQAWRNKYRDAALRNQVLTDPHSPSQYRCNGTVRNMEAWYAAFDVGPDNALYLAPTDRVLIW
jgi:putative endopeptidase